jgi:hypothetical protein
MTDDPDAVIVQNLALREVLENTVIELRTVGLANQAEKVLDKCKRLGVTLQV